MRHYGTVVAVCTLAGAANGQCEGPLFDAWEPFPEYNGILSAIATGDLDGDGDIDAVLSLNAGTDATLVFINNGTGWFTELPAVESPFTTKLVLADLDGDTDPDVIIDGNPIRFLINDGTGAMTLDPTELVAGDVHTFGDVDADGDTDIVNIASRRAQVYEHTSPLVFSYVYTPGTEIDAYGHGAELVDLDADTDLDLMLIDAIRGLGVSLNDGAGVFGAVVWVDPDESPYYDQVHGDVDNDGDIDVIITSSGSVYAYSPSTHLLTNDGAGVFTDAGDLPVASWQDFPPSLYDIDGDGNLDYYPGDEAWSSGHGNGTFDSLSAAWGWEWYWKYVGIPHWAAFADLDGDGLDEFMTPAYSDYLHTVYAVHGSRLAGPGDEVVILPGQPAFPFARPGDADGDGDTDVVVPWSGPIRMFANLGPGRLADPIESAPSVLSRNIHFADFDLNGAIDVMSTSNVVRVSLNDGHGSFVDSFTSDPYGPELLDGAAVGLFNDDPFPDVLAVSRVTADVAVWLGNGDGTFALPILTPVAKSTVFGTALGDFDSDGALDAALVEQTGRLILLRGQNDGTFVFAGEHGFTPSGTGMLEPAEAGDVDSDGDLDVVCLERRSGVQPGVLVVYRNDGGWIFSHFEASIGFAVRETTSRHSVFIEDITGDGLIDVAVSRGVIAEDDNLFSLIPGDGAGGLGSPTVYRLGAGRFSLAGFADMDGDGDLDAVEFGESRMNRIGGAPFDGAVGIAFNRCTSPGCAADLTTVNAPVGDPGYGVPDGAVTAADIQFYVNAWVAHDAAIADLTTQNAPVGDPNYGVPDGLVSAVDIQFYVNLWIQGCP